VLKRSKESVTMCRQKQMEAGRSIRRSKATAGMTALAEFCSGGRADRAGAGVDGSSPINMQMPVLTLSAMTARIMLPFKVRLAHTCLCTAVHY
jgi:hypothetical protein